MYGKLEKRRVWLLVLAALMLTLTTLACGGTDSTLELTTMLEQADTPQPTAIPESADTPEPTGAPEPTNTSEPTNTPEPTPIVEPTISIEDLEEKWHTPLYAAALTVGAYESLLNTAERRQAEEIDGMTALGELVGAGVILKTVEEILPGWEPSQDQIEHKAAIQNYVDAAQEVIGQWLDKEITSADVPGLLEDSYSASQDTLQSVLLAMKDDGLSEDDIEFMLDELSQALDELAQALETEKPTPTGSPEPESVSRTMYVCGYDHCRDSGTYGELILETGINVWSGHDPDRGMVHHQVAHGDEVMVISEVRVEDGPGGLWYELEDGGWISDLWLTDEVCTPDNLEKYSLTTCW